jgi:hypothetical protein
MRDSGFVLIVSLILAILMSSLASLAFLLVNKQWNLAADFEAQIRSELLAENGVEYARHLLPYLEIDDLLLGVDGVPCGLEKPEWRNPMPFDLAHSCNLNNLNPDCDNGLLVPPLDDLGNAEQGTFLVRFSNNPQEGRFSDFDRVLIARSMGIVPERLSTVFAPEIRNCVTVLEIRLRQELLFQLPSPVLVFGDFGDFEFNGTEFVIDGGNQFAISLVGLSSSGLVDDLTKALLTEQLQAIRGGGLEGSIREATEDYHEEVYSKLFEASFWRHFTEHVSDFADPFPPDHREPGLYFLPEGGVLEGSYVGVIVARGDLQIIGNAEITGLLIHLGDGQLRLADHAVIDGGVWLSDLDYSGDRLNCQQVSLGLSGYSRIGYAPEAIRSALRCMPATQLGWRMIFPEMNSE